MVNFLSYVLFGVINSYILHNQSRLEVLNAQVQENVQQKAAVVANEEEITQISLKYALDVENIGMAIARKLVNNNTISFKTSDIGLVIFVHKDILPSQPY